MTEALEPTTETGLAIAGDDYGTSSEYVGSAGYFTTVWRSTKSQEAKNAAVAQGIKLDSGTVLFGVKRAGNYEYIQPFSFFLINSAPVFNLKDKKGDVIRMVSAIPKNDPDADKFREGWIAVLAVLQGSTLVPAVATVGRFEGAMKWPIQNAKTVLQQYSKPDLAAKGPAYATAAAVKLVPWRAIFTLAAKPETGTNGDYLKGSASSRPISPADLQILQDSGVFDPTSDFTKDFNACYNVYLKEKRQAEAGWVKA